MNREGVSARLHENQKERTQGAIMNTKSQFPVVSRKSPLALAQANSVARALGETLGLNGDEQSARLPVLGLVSSGDKNLAASLADAGGKGLFTKEIEEALLERRARIAVHSMKDMPVLWPPGLIIGAIHVREDPRDAFISNHFQTPWELPSGSTVGTASVRRRAQLLARRPDLTCVSLRGNVSTRLSKIKLGDADGTFLAIAGLKRLGLDKAASRIMPVEEMLPAVGQGALCIQVREDDDEARKLVEKVACPVTSLCVLAERAFMAQLDGSCRTPLAGHCTIKDGTLTLTGEILQDASDDEGGVSVKSFRETASLSLPGNDRHENLRSSELCEEIAALGVGLAKRLPGFTRGA